MQSGIRPLGEQDMAPRGWNMKRLLLAMLMGLGMFCESYFIFTTGQMHGIWKAAYPGCWNEGGDITCPEKSSCTSLFPNASSSSSSKEDCEAMSCSKSTRVLLSSSEFVGIMFGMLIFAALSDKVGRRMTSAAISIVMLLGSLWMVLTPFAQDSTNRLFESFTVGFVILGFGIGGEYPLSSVSATERAEEEVFPSQRGAFVATVFTMQGVGAIVGSAVVSLSIRLSRANLVDCSEETTNVMGYTAARLVRVWRSVYAVGFCFLVVVVVYRLFFTRESAAYVDRGSTLNSVLFTRLRTLFKFYCFRLAGTTSCWFLWDICFYGNKLFISSILSTSMRDDRTLLREETYILVNNGVALVGYLAAVVSIDRMGRRYMQLVGFAILAVVFLGVFVLFPSIEQNMGLFFGLYLVTSFFGQFGPNATTYLIPAESFPTEVRSVAHGLSAFAGKGGALLGTTVFGLVGTRTIFLLCGVVSCLGALVTALLVAEISQLDLEEIDSWHLQRKMELTPDEISSQAALPTRLSVVERWLGWSAPNSGELVKDTFEERTRDNDVM